MRKKPVDMKMLKEARERLSQIALAHPELVDADAPLDERQREWEATLKEILLDEKLTFTIEEAAELLSCHKDTIRRAIKGEMLKAGKIGKDYRISRCDLEEYYRMRGGGQLFSDDH